MSAEKRFPPTRKRRRRARADGDVLRCRELTAAAAIGLLTLQLALLYDGSLGRFSWADRFLAACEDFLTNNVLVSAAHALYVLLETVVPLLFVLCGGVLLAEIAQVGLPVPLKPLSLQWSRLNPVRGCGRTLGLVRSPDGVPFAPIIEVLRIAAYTSVIGAACAAWLLSTGAFIFSDLESANDLVSLFAALIVSLGQVIAAAALVSASFHLFMLHRRREKRLRMTREELERELREEEGSAEAKAHRRELHRELLTRDVIDAVRSARIVVMRER